MIDIHLALCQLHDNVRRLESGVIGEICPDAEGTTDFVLAIFLNLQCFCEIEGIAENDSLGGRVNSQFFVTGYQTVYKFKFITGIAADTVK